MPPRLTRSAFAASHELPDWRIVRHALVAVFRGSSFHHGADFVARVADEADTLDHHPDVDLRYPGRVRVALTTHAVHGLTELDATLAQRISALAAEMRFVAEPVRGNVQIAIDALDIPGVVPFWRALLGYVDDPALSGEPVMDALVDPLRMGPEVWFQQMDAPRPQRNRMHLDVRVPHDQAEDRIRAAVAAGGRLLDDSHARAFWVLADPEGNEACVCTWQDRD